MSRHRATPGRGYVIASLLPKGPGGRPLCRFCKQEVQPPRRTFCSDACVHEWRIRSDPGYAKLQVWIRDRGKCRACGIRPTPRAVLSGMAHLTPEQRETRTQRALFNQNKSRWAMDHVLAVQEGGGECGLDGLQTLCHPCHQAKTKAHAGRRAMERRRSIKPARG